MDPTKFGFPRADNENGEKSDYDADQKLKRKRRSKNDPDGRSFRCVHCDKCYLSNPALTNHIKTKHPVNDPNSEKRGRGRPRKNPQISIMPDRDINKFKSFFEKEERTRKQEYNLLEAFSFSIADLYNNYKHKIFLDLPSVELHPFLKEVQNQSTNEPTLDKSEMKTCDQIFASYILEYYLETNREYFIFLSKFVTLFRECINVYRKNQDSSEEFTTKDGADTVPDLCNEFITEFMESRDNFNLDQNEVIELIQHFCYWLYENKFTTSRLTLLS